jgi:hypothetical protein
MCERLRGKGRWEERGGGGGNIGEEREREREKERERGLIEARLSTPYDGVYFENNIGKPTSQSCQT